MGNVAEPDTKHYLHKDVYTHITYDDYREERANAPEKFLEVSTTFIKPGDSLFAGNSIIVFKGFDKDADKSKTSLKAEDIAVAGIFEAINVNKKTFVAKPIYAISKQKELAYSFPDTINELGLAIEIKKLIPEKGQVEVKLSERNSNQRDFIILKAIVFPGINILWLGCLVMIIGTVMAIGRRVKN
jgi:cytochrome c-type biogenesis protein CcmF